MNKAARRPPCAITKNVRMYDGYYLYILDNVNHLFRICQPEPQ